MLRRIGRPGLLRTMARTAAVAGTATAVHRSVSRVADSRDQDKAAAEAYYAEHAQPATAPAMPAASGDDLTTQIDRLAQLHSSGVLSDDEFAAAKRKLLG